MTRAALPLIALATACAPDARLEAQQAPALGTGVCKAEGLDDLIGKPRGDAVGAEAKRRSGARVLRWIPVGVMVTMDYRTDRLDLRLDSEGRITQISCG